MTETPANILVIKLGALGDFIQALGPMAAIRAAHPHDKITLLTTKPYETLARESGYANEIIIDKRPKWFDVKGWTKLRTFFNSGRFARVYDLQNNDRTSFYFRLFAPKPEWVGVARGASHRNTSPKRTEGKAFDGHVQTLGLAGIKNIQIDRLEWMKGTLDLSALPSRYVLFVAGSSPKHPYKRWPTKHYAALGKRLVESGFTPVLIGAKEESGILEEIHSLLPQSINLCGETNLSDIPALARGAIGAIGNDTGPMHLIAPTGCKSIILFSQNSDPRRHAPKGHDVITLQKQNLEDLKPDDVWNAFVRQQSLVS